MTDPRTEAARIGFWDEGIGAWDDGVGQTHAKEISAFAHALIRKSMINPPAREDDK